MSSSYTNIAFTQQQPDQQTAKKLNLLIGDLSSALDAIGGYYSAQWNWTTSTTDATAKNGIGINAATWNAASFLNVNTTANDGRDMSMSFSELFVAGNDVYIQEADNAANHALYTITAAGTNHGSWWQFPVTPKSSNGVTPGNNVDTNLTVYVKGGTGGGGAGTGDMTKVIYDTNANGICDTCDSLAWSKLTGLPATFIPSVHAPTHLDNGTDPIPVVTTSRTGLVPMLNGNAATYLNGNGAFAAGPTGPQGPAGPTAISANANNKATLGTDTLLLVQGVAAGASATTHAQTVSGDDPQLTNARTPLTHAVTHKSGGSDAIALDTLAATTDITTLNSSTTAHGLLPKLSGTTTTYLRGDGTWQIVPGGGAGFVSKTAAYTLVSADSGKYLICSGGSWTLTLPTAAIGLYFQIRNDMGITGTTGTITLSPPSGTIDGAASLSLLAGQECTLITDGINWRTLGRQRVVVLGNRSITTTTASDSFLLPPGYTYYEFDCENISGSVDSSWMVFLISNDGGSTWKTDAGYALGNIYNTSTTAVSFNSVTNAQANLSATGTWVTNTGSSANAYMKFWPGDGTLKVPHWKGESWTYDSTITTLRAYVQGGRYVTTPILVNAIQYKMSSGNIANSQVIVKGVL